MTALNVQNCRLRGWAIFLFTWFAAQYLMNDAWRFTKPKSGISHGKTNSTTSTKCPKIFCLRHPVDPDLVIPNRRWMTRSRPAAVIRIRRRSLIVAWHPWHMWRTTSKTSEGLVTCGVLVTNNLANFGLERHKTCVSYLGFIIHIKMYQKINVEGILDSNSMTFWFLWYLMLSSYE